MAGGDALDRQAAFWSPELPVKLNVVWRLVARTLVAACRDEGATLGLRSHGLPASVPIPIASADYLADTPRVNQPRVGGPR